MHKMNLIAALMLAAAPLAANAADGTAGADVADAGAARADVADADAARAVVLGGRNWDAAIAAA